MRLFPLKKQCNLSPIHLNSTTIIQILWISLNARCSQDIVTETKII